MTAPPPPPTAPGNKLSLTEILQRFTADFHTPTMNVAVWYTGQPISGTIPVPVPAGYTITNVTANVHTYNLPPSTAPGSPHLELGPRNEPVPTLAGLAAAGDKAAATPPGGLPNLFVALQSMAEKLTRIRLARARFRVTGVPGAPGGIQDYFGAPVMAALSDANKLTLTLPPGTPAPAAGNPVTAAQITTFMANLLTAFTAARSNTSNAKDLGVGTGAQAVACHSNCHSNCHGSRGRR